MLSKLLKHEFKATARFFLPVYGIFAALLAVQRLSILAFDALRDSEGIIGTISAFLMGLLSAITILGLIAMIALPLVYAAIRFWRNLLGDEGYLSFTLPVTAGQHITAKLLTGIAWELLSLGFVVLCGFLYALSMDPEQLWGFFSQMGRLWHESYRLLGGGLILFLGLLILSLITQQINNLMTLYSAMSMGQTTNRHKLLSSAGIYVAISFATGMLLQIGTAAAAILFHDPLAAFALGIDQSTPQAIVRYLSVFLAGTALLNLLSAALHYFLSHYFLSRKLNLA